MPTHSGHQRAKDVPWPVISPQGTPPAFSASKPICFLGIIARIDAEVQGIILFGSRTRGDAVTRSDIDLAIETPDATRRQWLELTILVEEAQTLLPIDLVRLEETSPALQGQTRAE